LAPRMRGVRQVGDFQDNTGCLAARY
jgi:hypothetical protein